MSSLQQNTRYIVFSLAALSLTAALAILWPREAAVPDVQGAVLPNPKALTEITLTNHLGNPVNTEDFRNQWHLISYGFTHCPDVCPTLLSDLARFQRLLDEQARYKDLQIWFYSIDPGRDSVEKLANYVPWFSPDFIGLRAPSDNQAQHFENSLGMRAEVIPSEQPEDYQVAHGFRLYLLDDKGRLRAALAPTRNRQGQQFYEPETLLKDYLALRHWAG